MVRWETLGNYFEKSLSHICETFVETKTKLTPVVGNDIGLYRDDGLAALNKTPREIENIKKYICQTLNEYNLKLTIEANKKTVNFLDVTLDLNSSTTNAY